VHVPAGVICGCDFAAGLENIMSGVLKVQM